MTTPKQKFTHKPTLPRNPKEKEKRESHGEKVQPQKKLAERR